MLNYAKNVPYGGKCVSVFPVSVWHDSGLKNDPIHLKFLTNVYALCKSNCIAFRIYCLNNVYTRVLKIISLLYGLWREIL